MLPASEELYVEVTKYNPPFQVTVFAAEACVPTCPLSSPISHTAWLPWCPERAPPSCQRPWRILYVLPWLDLDLRNRVMEAQKITDELFSDDGEGGAGGELNQIDLDLMDDYPTSDPRWAESVPDKNAGFPLTSLILLHKLAVSLKNHHSKQPELVNAAIAVTLTSGGEVGVRTVITRQHDVILRSVYPHADSRLHSTLSEQLVALLDSLLVATWPN
ncbi:nuclear pore complex protein Nup133 [Silurus meridionalis]|nr:nuclear pore complex protein Nup133 [Silurus meridionalis]